MDAQGKTVREVTVTQPTGVQHLPGGHIPVTSRLSRRAREIDRTGKTVW